MLLAVVWYGNWTPCATSAVWLFCVVRRGVDRMRPLPLFSSAVSATSRLKAPLIEPSARPIAELRGDGQVDGGVRRSLGVPAAGIGRPLDGAAAGAPTRPPREPLFGNARPVVLPIGEFARPLKPHWMPSARAKSRVVWTTRASTSTCGCGLSSVAISDCAVCRRSGRSVMISVLVRVSTWICPRADSADLRQQRPTARPPWRSSGGTSALAARRRAPSLRPASAAPPARRRGPPSGAMRMMLPSTV